MVDEPIDERRVINWKKSIGPAGAADGVGRTETAPPFRGRNAILPISLRVECCHETTYTSTTAWYTCHPQAAGGVVSRQVVEIESRLFLSS